MPSSLPSVIPPQTSISSELEALRRVEILGNQHFLLSPYCRTFTLKNLRTFDEERSYKAFCFIRWPDTEGRPTCVRCSYSNCWVLALAFLFALRRTPPTYFPSIWTSP